MIKGVVRGIVFSHCHKYWRTCVFHEDDTSCIFIEVLQNHIVISIFRTWQLPHTIQVLRRAQWSMYTLYNNSKHTQHTFVKQLRQRWHLQTYILNYTTANPSHLLFLLLAVGSRIVYHAPNLLLEDVAKALPIHIICSTSPTIKCIRERERIKKQKN